MVLPNKKKAICVTKVPSDSFPRPSYETPLKTECELKIVKDSLLLISHLDKSYLNMTKTMTFEQLSFIIEIIIPSDLMIVPRLQDVFS